MQKQNSALEAFLPNAQKGPILQKAKKDCFIVIILQTGVFVSYWSFLLTLLALLTTIVDLLVEGIVDSGRLNVMK